MITENHPLRHFNLRWRQPDNSMQTEQNVITARILHDVNKLEHKPPTLYRKHSHNSRNSTSVLSSRGNSVLWLSYGLDDRGSIPGRGKDFFLRHRDQICSGANPAYQMGTGRSFTGLNGRGVELTTHIHLAPRLRMRGATPPLLHTYTS
jgi:hypothetical protein